MSSPGTMRLLEDERTRRPAVVDLARALSLATRIEPALVRAMRLELAPSSDPAIETDLWFSPLVQVRSQRALTLLPAVVASLRTELAADTGRVVARRAWKVISRLHGIPDDEDGFTRAAVSPALALEETLTYFATLGTPAALARVEGLLGRALASLRQKQDRGIARWAVRTLPRLPENARHSGVALALAQLASAQMGGIPIRGVLSAPGDVGSWTPQLLASLPTVAVGLRVLSNGLELSEPPFTGASVIDVPITSPLILDVTSPTGAGWQTVRPSITRGTIQVVDVPVGPVLRVGTLTGGDRRVAPEFDGHVRGVWLIDRTGRSHETGRVLRDAVGDLGWDVQRFNEAVGSPFAVVVWRFGYLEQLETAGGGGAFVSRNEVRSARRRTIVWVADRFVVSDIDAVERVVMESYDRAGKTFDPTSQTEGDFESWTLGLLRQARRLFDETDAPKTATTSNLRAALIEIEKDRAAEWFRTEQAKQRDANAAADRDDAAPRPAQFDTATALRGREDVLDSLASITSVGGPIPSGVILIGGGAGVGKSAIARAFVEARRREGFVATLSDVELDSRAAVDQVFLSAAQDLTRQLDIRVEQPRDVHDALGVVLEAALRQGRVDRDRPIVLMLDRLDGPDRNRNPFEVIDAYLPARLPDGVFVITTARHRAPNASWFASVEQDRSGRLQVFDLDHPMWRRSADRAIERFWRESNVARDFGETDIVLAIGFSQGNYRIAEMLYRWFKTPPAVPHVPGDLGEGLRGIVQLVLLKVRGLPDEEREYAFAACRLLAVAREPIPLVDLISPQGPSVSMPPMSAEQALAALSPLLAPKPVGVEREALIDRRAILTEVVALSPSETAEHGLLQTARGHRELLTAIDGLLEHATHASPSVQWAGGYRSRYGLEHAIDGHLTDRATALCSSLELVQELIAARGYDGALEQIDRVDRLRPADSEWADPLRTILQIVREYGTWLAREPHALMGIAHDHLRRAGRSDDDIATEFRIDGRRLPTRLAGTLGTSFEEVSRFFEGHTAGVMALATAYRVSTAQAISPAVVVSGDRGGAVKAWDLREHRLLWTLASHESAVTAVAVMEWAFGPQAQRRGVSGDRDGVLRVWDVASGEELATLEAHSAAIVACDISANGRWIVSAAHDRTVFVGGMVMSRSRQLGLERVDSSATGPQRSIACAVAIVDDSVLMVFRDGRVLRRPVEPTGSPPGWEASLGGTVSGCSIDRRTGDVTARLAGGVICTLGPDRTVVPIVQPGPDEVAHTVDSPCVGLETQVAFVRDDTIVLTPRRDGGPRRTLRGHRDMVRGLARGEVRSDPGPDLAQQLAVSESDRLVSASDDGTVGIWNPDDGRPLAMLGEFGRPFQLMDVDDSERTAVFPFEPNALVLYDVAKNKRIGEPRRFDARVTACRFASTRRPSGKAEGQLPVRHEDLLAIGLADGRVLTSRDEPHQRFEQVQNLASPVTVLEWLGDPLTLVMGSADGRIGVVRLDMPGDPDAAGYREQLGPLGVAVIDDGWFVSYGAEGELLLWDTGGSVRGALRTRGEGERVRAAATHPSSRWLAAGLADGTVLVWDRKHETYTLEARGNLPDRLASLGRGVAACMIAPASGDRRDGERLLCGLDDGRIVVLDPKSGATDGVFEGHAKAINGLALLPDGRHVASWSLDGSLCVWDVRERRAIGTTYSRAPFIAARVAASGRIYALDALGQAWQIAFP